MGAPNPPVQVRESPIHGKGIFAARRMRSGQRIIEYVGERISPDEANARYDDDQVDHPHILLFTVDETTVIDGAHGGNESVYINHSCAPNCEAVNEDGRIFVEALRDIAMGEELTYDYNLERPGRYRAEWKERYRCLCGAPNCRGTMLAPPKTAARKSARKTKAATPTKS
jgi:SET domain-containing protein